MTVLELPRAIVRPPEPAARTVATWRFATRLAMREVRRRPGRTLLVVLLILVPVMAMTIGDVIEHTQNDKWSETYRRRFGASDAAVEFTSDENVATMMAALPEVRIVSYRTASAVIPATPQHPRQTFVNFTDIPLDDSVTAGIIELRSGRFPTAPGEALVSPSVAKDFGLAVGDSWDVPRPAVRLIIVGIGRRADLHSDALVVVRGVAAISAAPFASITALVDAPAPLTDAQIALLLPRGPELPTAEPGPTDASSRALAWGFVAGVLILAAVGIIIAAAFATSARRQLVTLGQLSANGASQRLLRRTMTLQGSVSGAIGGVVGVCLGCVALLLGKARFVERVLDRSVGPYQWSGVDLLAIIATATVAASVAAFIPARTVARVPVLSALAGRRPLGAVPRRLVPIGVLFFSGGLVLMVLAALGSQNRPESQGGLAVGPVASHGDLYAAVAIVGGLGVLIGACCFSPVMVGLLGSLGRRFRGAPKLAARSIARLRTRSAAVVTAIAVTGALAIALGAFVERSLAQDASDTAGILQPLNEVQAIGYSYGLSGADADPPLPSVPDLSAARAAVSAALPEATFTPVREALYDPSVVPAGTPEVNYPNDGRIAIADDAWIDLARLDAVDRSNLATVGAILTIPGGEPDSTDGNKTVALYRQTGVTRLVAATRHQNDNAFNLVGQFWLVVTPAKATELGLTIVDGGFVATSPNDLTSTQRAALGRIQQQLLTLPDAFTPATSVQSYVQLNYPYVPSRLAAGLIRLAIMVGALLFTLAVVAIGLSLSASESRDERDVLESIGAKPSTMRRVAGLKATWLALAGGLLAIPTGYLPIAAAVAATTSDRSFDVGTPFPWRIAVVLVILIPIAAGLGAWLASSIVQTVRPLRMSAQSAD